MVAGTAAVNLKNELREAIETDLRSPAGISHAFALTHPEMSVHVRLPRGKMAEVTFLTIARVAVAHQRRQASAPTWPSHVGR